MSDKPKTVEDAILESVVTHTVGTNGGSDFAEDIHVLKSGAISKIEVRSGAEIDNILVYYGDVPGKHHGGSKGSPRTPFAIPRGYDIYRIEGRAGERVDQLRFVAKTADGSQVISSELFGGGGGSPFTFDESERGLVLRQIRGRSGGRIDKLRFDFGYPVRIENVEVDEPVLIAQLKKGSLKSINSITFENNSDESTSAAYSDTTSETHSQTITRTHTVNAMMGYSYAIGAKASFKMGEISATQTFTFQFSYQYTYGVQETDSKSYAHTWNVNIPCPARKRTTASIQVLEATLKDVPFTYDIVFYENINGKMVEKYRFTESATMSGTVPSSSLIVDISSEDIVETDGLELGLRVVG